MITSIFSISALGILFSNSSKYLKTAKKPLISETFFQYIKIDKTFRDLGFLKRRQLDFFRFVKTFWIQESSSVLKYLMESHRYYVIPCDSHSDILELKNRKTTMIWMTKNLQDNIWRTFSHTYFRPIC